MARIAVITHEYDCFQQYRFGLFLRRRFLLQDLLRDLRARGHQVEITIGPDQKVEADAAILHLDCSVVPPAYHDLVDAYPLTVNGAALDITKRTIGGAGVVPDGDWHGPVIVKSNYNSGGRGEDYHNREAKRRGHPPPHPYVDGMVTYTIHDSVSQVPGEAWEDQHTVVERLIPELDPQGYAMRTWIFFGGREWCTRNVGPQPIIKGPDIIARAPSHVPDNIRDQRRRLGFDYGKFDFVVEGDEGVLLDANRTPGSSRNLGREQKAATSELTRGFDTFLK